MIGLDGFPWTLARRLIEEGVMPNLGALAEEGDLVQMDSVYPTISGVAWSCFQTGKNPGKFGIYGFAELTSGMDLFVPDTSHLRSRTIWEILADHGKKSICLGVPVTYPPRPVDGIMVGGFLSPSLEKAVYPRSALPELIRLGYRIDIDPVKARESLDYFKKENLEVLEGRIRTLFACWEKDWWDLLMVHFMDSDRVNHFMFKYSQTREGGFESENHRYFFDFYSRIDQMLGKVRSRLREDQTLIILSDHGFCPLKHEVQLNYWLADRGYLEFDHPPAHDLDFKAISPRSRAFSLVPGRVYLLREGVWGPGRLSPSQAEDLLGRIIEELREMAGPGGEKVCRKVFRREEVFSGPFLDTAPDIVIDPQDGFDFKAGLKQSGCFTSGPINGMHTFSDALVLIRGRKEYSRRPVIWDLAPTLLEIFDIPLPPDLDGVSLGKG